MQPPNPCASLRFDTARAMQAFGGRIGEMLRPGDAVCLFGPLGAGKSTLARGLVRTLVGDRDHDVPSPTFTLMQVYDTPRFPLAHFDFYRLARPEEVHELGLDEALEQGAAVIEWSERLGEALPPDRLDVRLQRGAAAMTSLDGSGEPRWAQVQGHGAWVARAEALHVRPPAHPDAADPSRVAAG